MAENQTSATDEHLWLEDVHGEKSIAWVNERNQRTAEKFTKSKSFGNLEKQLREILDSDDRIPFISKLGEFYYNFWQDEDNPKGILRRTTLDEYMKEVSRWEVVLDIDKLSAVEGENWVYAGSQKLLDHDRTLINLSRGGSDAVVVREFDLKRKEFVAGGYFIEEAKSDVTWLSLDELLVGTDFGDESLTDSGYPRIVKLWKRGQPLQEAQTIFTGEKSDVGSNGYSDLTKGYEVDGVIRSIDFFNFELYMREADGKLLPLDKPKDAHLSFHRNWVFIELKTDWRLYERTFLGNSLLVIDREAYLEGDRDFDVLFAPSQGNSLAGFSTTKNHVLINVLSNVHNAIYSLTHTSDGWEKKRIDSGEQFQTVSVGPVEDREDDRYWLTSAGFVSPTTYSIGEVGKGDVVLKRAPHMFDSSDLEVSQHWTGSADGTRVPYFLVRKKDVTGPTPTLLYGYGGFEISLLPQYMSVTGAAWMERGGTYVIANIRGGGEFGPSWHHAALKEKRPRVYEDFIAVAEDLVKQGITTKSQLGAAGGSNGGLLMGNMLTMRPDLFAALAISVPLIDMSRYHKLLAGASWMAEYGDPDDPAQWEFIKSFSPYHNLVADIEYPEILVMTSTRDDRVHPGHARKLVAKLTAFGHNVWYYENTEGGHAGAADNSQRAFMSALEYEFLWGVLNN